MEHYWIPIGFGLIVVVPIVLLTKLIAISKRRETLRKLGFPVNTRLTARQAEMLRTFVDTETRLRKSFPGISDAQRQTIARDVLRD